MRACVRACVHVFVSILGNERVRAMPPVCECVPMLSNGLLFVGGCE